MRTFIGIKIPVQHSISVIYNNAKLALAGERISWIPPENFHITLQFLGDNPTSINNEIVKMLNELLGKIPVFTFSIKGVGVFPKVSQPRVIWLGVEDSGIMEETRKLIEDKMATLGFPISHKPFNPHLTLGRIKSIANTNSLLVFIEKFKSKYITDVNVRKVIFYESVLGQRGAIYKELHLVECTEIKHPLL